MSTEWTDRLRTESAQWVRQGLISDAQRGAILKLYPSDLVHGRDRTILVLSILGSLLVGAGVLLYVAANWPRIPASIKVMALLAATLASYGTGLFFQVRANSPRLGQSLVFLGSLLYGASIWLIAQIFHLDSDYPTGFLVWGAGVLPVVWVTGSRPVLCLAAGLLTIWTVGAQGTLAAYNFLFPVLMLGAVLPLARRTQTRLVEAGTLLGLFLWFMLNVGRLDLTGANAAALVLGRLAALYGSLLFLLGLGRTGDGRVYLGSGGFLALLGAYLLTFSGNGGLSPDDRTLPSLFAGSPFTLAGTILLLAGVGVAAWWYGRQGDAQRRYLLPAALVPVAAVLLTDWLPELLRMVLFNLLLFAGAVGLIALGIGRRMGLLLNLGLIAFAIHLITRYFDLFFTALNRSIFFMLGGLLLLAGGWFLERTRRRWVGDWGGGGDEP